MVKKLAIKDASTKEMRRYNKENVHNQFGYVFKTTHLQLWHTGVFVAF